MLNSVAHFFSSDEEEDETRIRNLIQIRRSLRQESNPFDLPDSQFVRNFRLNKEAFRYLCGEIESHIKKPTRSTSVPCVLKLAATLRLLGDGGYQQAAGNDFNLGLAQSTISTVFQEIIEVIEEKICPMWVRCGMTEEEKSEAKLCFFIKFRFPGVIGCIDGTYIKIIAPKKEEQHLYYNRKGFYSLNAMIICDHNMVIRCLDARHPGASHDALVWNTSELKVYLKSKFDNGEKNAWLFGDAGYPLEPFLMTPFRSSEEESAESRYNTAHTKARNIIERTIDMLKNRFRCFLGARQMHYKPDKAIQVVNVCAALHNICNQYRVPVEETFPHEPDITERAHFEATENLAAVNTRHTIMNSIINSSN